MPCTILTPQKKNKERTLYDSDIYTIDICMYIDGWFDVHGENTRDKTSKRWSSRDLKQVDSDDGDKIDN